ncbi:MAG: YiiX/YebB-like N1pC/P60 family cysteine hydrolase [Patescibacteria group bacterium]
MPTKKRGSSTKRGRREISPLEKINGQIPELEIADIVFVRHKKGLTRWLLRKVTRSYWDHTALIIFPRDYSRGYANNIIIEAIQHGLNSSYKRGVEVHRLDKYLNDPKKYDVGIKRIPWLSEDMKQRVRAFMLMNVDTPYYPIFTSKFFLAWVSKTYRKYLNSRQRYSCSGLVQKSFYEASDWQDRTDVIFRGSGYTPIEIQEITSPADIANSDAGVWIWNKR